MASEKEIIEKTILRIRRKFEEGIPLEKKLKYLKQLIQLPITLEILKKTSIGKIVNTIRKEDGRVGELARDLILKWKDIATAQKNIIEPSITTGKNDINLDNSKYNNTDNKKSQNQKYPIEESIGVSLSHGELLKEDDSNENRSTQPKCKKMSFEDMLMMPIITENKKKKKRKNNEKFSKGKVMPSLPDIELPSIAPEPVYLPRHPVIRKEENISSKRKNDMPVLSDITSRKTRSSIFSGKKVANGVVLSLYQQCMRVLVENVDALYETGGVPYFVLEPLLTKCSPQQLERLEDYNPHFIEDSDDLWKRHCQHDFKGMNFNKKDEELWRDVYKRLCDEREVRLKRLSSKITEAQAAKLPERSVKLAYIAGAPKPSAQMLRKQKKYGTGSGSIGEKKKELRDRLEKDQRKAAESVVPFTNVPRRDRCAFRPPTSLSVTNQSQDGPSFKKRKGELGGQSHFIPKPVKKPVKKPMMTAALKLLQKQKGRMNSSVMRR